MNVKLTGKEKRWIMYDVGNSAFALLAEQTGAVGCGVARQQPGDESVA